ncbi:barstar family protein [Terrabacter sp. GCM10028922]|uniref:barstar family protein n=1 Tax=Terrabacter sp. GCM10028922 TaxID=3273428 RepID=UPI00361FACC1
MTGSLALKRVEAKLRPLLFEGDAQAVGTAVTGWVESGLTARVVRGRKMRTLAGLLDEFAAALQFPPYFGENRDAFTECLAEMETLPAGEGYVVTITEPDQVLAEADSAALSWLARSLASAAEEWAQPVELGEWWDRAPIPFHVVLAGERVQIESAARLWSAAGVQPISFGRQD